MIKCLIVLLVVFCLSCTHYRQSSSTLKEQRYERIENSFKVPLQPAVASSLVQCDSPNDPLRDSLHSLFVKSTGDYFYTTPQDTFEIITRNIYGSDDLEQVRLVLLRLREYYIHYLLFPSFKTAKQSGINVNDGVKI